jgi:hypothetical protein
MGDLDELARAAGGLPPRGVEWHVSQGGQAFGPYTDAECRAMLAAGRFAPGAQFWREGLSAWLPPHLAFAPQPSYRPVPGVPAVPYATRPVRHGGGWIARYKARCGFRSFLFQGILVGWTAMIGCWVLFMTFASVQAPRHNSPYYYVDRQERTEAEATAMLGSWCCLGGVWCLLAVPLGIAAVATYEGNR